MPDTLLEIMFKRLPDECAIELLDFLYERLEVEEGKEQQKTLDMIKCLTKNLSERKLKLNTVFGIECC